MTDAQLTILLAALATGCGIIGGSIRWAVSRVVKALDDNTKALSDNATAAAVQAETLRTVSVDIRHVADWCDAHTGVTSVPDGIREKRAATPARGVTYSVRPRTRSDEDR